MRFWAMMRSPRLSKRSLMAPVRLRRVASGLMIDSVRSVPIPIAHLGTWAVISDHSVSGNRRGETAPLRFSFPPACRLLPVGQFVSGLPSPAPTAPSRLYRAGIITVKKIGATREGSEILRFQIVDEDDHRGIIRVLIPMGQPDRLHL